MIATIFGFIALVTLLALTVFQLALIFGAPIGNYAWGGQHKVLPKKLRISSVTSIVLYAIFASFIATKAGILAVIHNPSILSIGMWAFTAYFFIGIFMNAISKSKKERMIMTPVAAILAIAFLIVTLS